MIPHPVAQMPTAGNVEYSTSSAESIVWRYGLAFASVAAALGLARTFLHYHLPQPFTAFALSAIGITFWFGGTWPGIVATMLASFVRYAHIATQRSFEPQSGAVALALYDLVFVVFALLMTMVTLARNKLELSVAERTAELSRANEDLKREITDHIRDSERLRQAQTDLARISRITTMGELTASLAHEVNQPIAAAVTNANTCLRWLTRDQPNMDEARLAASRIVADATRAADIISRVRMLFKKGNPQQELVDINEVIREMMILLRNETRRHAISVRTEIAADLPKAMADRVQLQQVFMNLMLNGIDAMKDTSGPRELTISSQPENNHLLISVSDTGVGLPSQQLDQIFHAFFTTKDHGTGMGLSISRSIIESHGGRLWAAENFPRGARFCFTLSTEITG
jgi:C4-dicarboxylate-specific signal transduction histidine kinase